MNVNIQSLQAQVDSLYSTLTALRPPQESNSLQHHHEHRSYRQPSLTRSASQPSYQNSISPSQPRGKHPRFQGPTSSKFNFDVANSSLQTMGITDGDIRDKGELNSEEPPLNSPTPNQSGVTSIVAPPLPDDPIWKIGKEEAIRLCIVYEEEIGITCPMFEIDTFITKANIFSTFSERAARTGLLPLSTSGLDSLDTDDIDILKLIYANTLAVEGYGLSELGCMLFYSVRETCQNKLWEPVDPKGLILLVLVVGVGTFPL